MNLGSYFAAWKAGDQNRMQVATVEGDSLLPSTPGSIWLAATGAGFSKVWPG